MSEKGGEKIQGYTAIVTPQLGSVHKTSEFENANID